MADITLAEFERERLAGRRRGASRRPAREHASPDVSIELVPCERKSDVRDCGCGTGGEPLGGDPWLIHPAIVARIMRRRAASPDYAVFFAQWSAMLDQDALAVIASAARPGRRQNPQATLALAEYLDPAGPQAIVDLSRLRAQLIEDKLVEDGVPRERISRIRREVGEVPGMAQESQRVDILLGP